MFQSPTEVALAVPESNDLDLLAQQFAERLSDNTFSPAEIIGYLMTKKADPALAISEVDEWKVGVLEKRELRARRRRKDKKTQSKKAVQD